MAVIFLTGHDGYLGRCTAEALRRAGHEVATLQGRLADLAPHSIRADHVVHLAAARASRPEEIHASNVEGSARLLAALRGTPGIIFSSSRAVYRPSSPPRLVDETEPPDPVDDYGRSKLAGERLIRESGLPHLILRPSALVGKGVDQLGHTFLTRMVKSALARGRVEAYAEHPVDPLHVRDLAGTIAAACTPGAHWNRTYNVAGPLIPLPELAAMVCRAVRPVTGKDCIASIAPATAHSFVLLDTTRIRSAGLLSHDRSMEAACEELAQAIHAAPARGKEK